MIAVVFILIGSSSLWAVAPLRHDDQVNLAHQLEYVEVEVNGEPVKVSNGGSLKVIVGDQLKIRSAQLSDHKSSPEVLNFRGYWHRDRPHLSDDRGFLIRTDTDLLSKWSVDAKGETYFIIARSKNEEHGRIRVEVSPPLLESMVLEINGMQRTVREGEKLHLTRKDKIKLVDVKSNVRVMGDDMTFNLVPIVHDKTTAVRATDKMYEMQLKRKLKIFARIGVVLEDK